MLFYEDKTFTVATGTDQYIATMIPIISPTITTCKGSRGGCSDEALQEITAVHLAREELSNPANNIQTKPMNNELAQQPAPAGKPIRYLSVCSGMEAASVAWHPLGWKPVGFSEIEPFPCAILKHRFPDVPNYGDLTKYADWPLAVGDVDLICGGTPCQAFSVAGLRQGLADPRGNLALVFLGLVDRLRPKYVLWENVPGVLSSNRGEDFAAFVGALAELGYGFAWRCVDAQFFGVPQRRKRVYLLAIQGAGNWRTAAEILFEPEGLRGDFEASRKAGQEATADAGSGVEAGGSILWNGSDQANAERVIDKAGTLNCDHGQRGGFICPIGEVSPVGTICADSHLGGYSGQDAYTGRLIPQITKPIVIDRAAFNQGQNAQYVPHIAESEVMDSLVARGPHAVGVPFRKSHWDGSDVHPTLNQSAKGSGGVGASNQELFSQGGAYLVPGQPIPIQDTRPMEKKQNGMGVGNPGDPAYTIDTTGAQSVAIPFRKSKRACSATDNETWVLADEANTLNNFDLGDTRTTHAVVDSTMAISFSP